GDDLAEGKPTLPLIYAMKNSTDSEKTLIENAIKTGGKDQLDAIIATVVQSGALDYTREKARKAIESALNCLDCLPDNEFRTGLEQVAEAALNRES
ncbi:MAG: octaprenyl-diphosphate synthase, partial [Pseudohongiellaceae bacterium]